MDPAWFFGLGMGFMLLIGLIWILALIFWIWMITDCVSRKFKNGSDKIVWVLVLIFLNVLGAGIYYFIVKSK
ncbi:PLDc N-terminal domain-containing protein [Candidatus Woesearchaeota archaeon]|nr:PLDc N-terminal domain-containing protein [Candidatus Woesearchaeota archaeon]